MKGMLVQTDTYSGESCGSQHPSVGGPAQHWPEDLHVWLPLSRQHHRPKQVGPPDGWQLCHVCKHALDTEIFFSTRTMTLKNVFMCPKAPNQNPV